MSKPCFGPGSRVEKGRKCPEYNPASLDYEIFQNKTDEEKSSWEEGLDTEIKDTLEDGGNSVFPRSAPLLRCSCRSQDTAQ